MKNVVSFCVFALLGLGAKAQTLPVSGATWIFEGQMMPWMFIDAYAEKWEYLGDSLAPNGTVARFRVSTRSVNPSGWDTTITYLSQRNFLYSGDTIRDLGDTTGALIANFSLQVGDSMLTPYYAQANMVRLSDGGGCGAEDTALIFQKGVVTETGTETADGITSAFYRLAFTDRWGIPVTVKFSQRSILTQRYWSYLPGDPFCHVPTEAPEMLLTCYRDDSMAAAPCLQLDMFDRLAVDDMTGLAKINLFPNPARDHIRAENPLGQSLRAELTDLYGRVVRTGIRLAASGVSEIGLHGLPAGVYVFRTVLPDGNSLRKKFVKQD